MTDKPFRPPAGARPPAGVDTSRASIARVHDASLGGKDNFEVDRRVLDSVLEVAPGMAEVSRRNRAWTRRVIRYLAGIVGVDQFLDAGAGLPAVGNTHEIAQLVNPWARVVYLDNDPMCVAHGRVLLETNEDTVYMHGDLTDPDVLAPDSAVWGYLDRARPVAVILGAVLHHIEDNVVMTLARLVTQTPEAGARSVLRAALDPEVPGAGFYGPVQRWGLVGPPVRLSTPAGAADPAAGRRLWAIAEELTGVEFGLGSPGHRPAAGDVPATGAAAAPGAESAGESA